MGAPDLASFSCLSCCKLWSLILMVEGATKLALSMAYLGLYCEGGRIRHYYGYG